MRARRYVPLSLIVLAVSVFIPRAGAAQQTLRLGLSFGGTGFLGVVAERLWDDKSAELLVTTFSFHDISISAVAKQYFGASWLRPAVGGGLWLMIGGSDEGTGAAIIARFPMGADWRIAGASHLTWEVNVARGLWVRRPDPTDDYPISTRLIPIPSVAYRVQLEE